VFRDTSMSAARAGTYRKPVSSGRECRFGVAIVRRRNSAELDANYTRPVLVTDGGST
jgi:hypothetical protein